MQGDGEGRAGTTAATRRWSDHVSATYRQHEVGAMRQIADPHHAENQRQPAAYQEQQRSIEIAVEGLDQPEVQVHYARSPTGNPKDWDGAYMSLGRLPARSIAALVK